MMGGDLRSLPRSIRWRIQLGLLQDAQGETDPNSALRELALHNQTIVRDQRSGYEKLAEKHYRQSSALAIISDTEVVSSLEPPHTNIATIPTSRNVKAAQRTGEKSSAKKQVKVFVDDPLSIMASMEEQKVKVDKQKQLERQRERAIASRPNLVHHPSAQNPGKVVHASQNDGRPGKGSQTRWEEFYSSKEIMDIIAKDLDRLPIDHHIYFHQRKTNEVMSTDDEEWNADNPITMQSREERSKLLSEILFVYAKEHPIGYRQGMHEILSFLLMAIEMDFLNLERSHRESGTVETDVVVRRCFFNDSKLLHDTYCIFNAVMSGLASAFEYRGDNSQMKEKMGDSTIRIIRDWYGDDELADFVSSLDVPPELYCTRWIRLMFSREVAGLDGVLALWDEFFKEVPSSFSLMKLLETTAAAMVILIQDQLIPPPQYNYEYDEFDTGDEHEAMHLLMNYPRIGDTSPLVEMFQKLMANQRSGVKPTKIQRVQLEPSMDHFLPPQNLSMMPFTHTPEMGDVMYYAQGPGANFIHPPPPQPHMHQLQHHQDQLLSSLKNLNLKSAPALAKLSSGLNEGLNAVRGALQSTIDHSFMSDGAISSTPANFYHPTTTPTATTRESRSDALGYRDLSTAPTIIDEHEGVFVGSNNFHGGEHATEGAFVGSSDFTSQPSFDDPLSNRDAVDLSQEISGRMNKSISKIATYLQNNSINSSSNGTDDVWNALSELEAIRRELTTKHQVSLKHSNGY